MFASYFLVLQLVFSVASCSSSHEPLIRTFNSFITYALFRSNPSAPLMIYHGSNYDSELISILNSATLGPITTADEFKFPMTSMWFEGITYHINYLFLTLIR